MACMKGITPIISIIILLLIAVALAGAAWTYISGFTSAYTSKVIDLPPGSSYFDGKNVKIMLRNIGTSAINTGSCSVSGQNNNTVTCGDITITREGSSNDADIRPSAASISPKGSITITDYACESGNVKYIISSPTSTYQVDVSADTPCSYPTDPVSWWKFDGNAKDSVGENHGTVYGATWVDDAERGKVASFDGVDDYVNIPKSTSLDFGTQGISIEWWMKMSAQPTNFKVLFGNKWQNAFGTIGWLIGVYGNTWVQLATPDGSANYHISRCAWKPGSWTHCVHVFERTVAGTTVSAYQDGVLQGTPEFAAVKGSLTNANPIQIYHSGNPIDKAGLIDEVRIYSRALSPEEIKALYNSQKK